MADLVTKTIVADRGVASGSNVGNRFQVVSTNGRLSSMRQGSGDHLKLRDSDRFHERLAHGAFVGPLG
jgi:hypothetical protein